VVIDAALTYSDDLAESLQISHDLGVAVVNLKNEMEKG